MLDPCALSEALIYKFLRPLTIARHIFSWRGGGMKKTMIDDDGEFGALPRTIAVDFVSHEHPPAQLAYAVEQENSKLHYCTIG
jgi:hypothetical protein